jgi:hypothetical protein
MHVSLCGFTCVADIPLPPNVYRYSPAPPMAAVR